MSPLQKMAILNYKLEYVSFWFFLGNSLGVGSALPVLFPSGAMTSIFSSCFKVKNVFSVFYYSFVLIFSSTCSSVFP